MGATKRAQHRPELKKRVDEGSQGPGWKQPSVPPNEMAWFNDPKCFAHWGGRDHGGNRCVYFNSTVGCHNPNCGFANNCRVCGQNHSAMAQHSIGDVQTCTPSSKECSMVLLQAP